MYVSLEALLVTVLSIAGLAALVFLIVFLIKATQLVRQTSEVLEKNEEKLSEILNHIQSISKNLDEMSEELESEVHELEKIFRNIRKTTSYAEEAVLSFRDQSLPLQEIVQFIRWVNRIIKKRRR